MLSVTTGVLHHGDVIHIIIGSADVWDNRKLITSRKHKNSNNKGNYVIRKLIKGDSTFYTCTL